jgi:hypothetical protein
MDQILKIAGIHSLGSFPVSMSVGKNVQRYDCAFNSSGKLLVVIFGRNSSKISSADSFGKNLFETKDLALVVMEYYIRLYNQQPRSYAVNRMPNL